MNQCRTCIFARSDGEADSASIPVYFCHRFPPILPPLAGGAENQFPKVRCVNWCGEFIAAREAHNE
jgi:hypothetical protein